LTKTIPPEKARQGRRGRQMLVVLICALILAAVAWVAVEYYARSIETPATQNQGLSQ